MSYTQNMAQCEKAGQYYYKNLREEHHKEEHKCKEIPSETSSFSQSIGNFNSTKLNVILTNKGLQVYGTWSKTKLLGVLTERLMQCIRVQCNASKDATFEDPYSEVQLNSVIRSGLYSVYVLKKLQERGMSAYSILKAMKLGLVNLNHCELSFFESFKVDPYVLQFEHMWPAKFDEELIMNLRTIGLTVKECWQVVAFGVVHQNADVLYRLMLSGIDITRILRWQSAIGNASSEVITFLKLIGIEEGIVQLVDQYGIDVETREMLNDLGYNKMKEKIADLEEIICECSLTVLELSESSLGSVASVCKASSDITDSNSDSARQFTCQCYTRAQTLSELIARQKDYLRQNVMVPLSWAMSRALNYGPTDPKYYIAYQLLRWNYGNVSQEEKDDAKKFVALATTKMDRKLILKKTVEQEEAYNRYNEEIMNDIPCQSCKDHQEVRRIKERCWKCIKKSQRKHEICEFPQLCSSCKIDSSSKGNSSLSP